MKKIILLSLFLFFINSACIAEDNENQNITNLDEVNKTIEIFFNAMQSGDVKKSFEMLTDNYKKLFEKKYGMNYLEAYGDEAYQAETHAHRFIVLEKKHENNVIYVTAEYYLKSSDSPDEDEKKVFTLKIINLKNNFMIDDIIYQE